MTDSGVRRVISYASTIAPKSQKLFSGALLEAAAARLYSLIGIVACHHLVSELVFPARVIPGC